MKNYRNNSKKSKLVPLIAFTAALLLLTYFFPVNNVWGLISNLFLSGSVGIIFALLTRKSSKSDETAQETVFTADKYANYAPEVRDILIESDRALLEMAKIYSTISDDTVKSKVNEIMRITDKISQDAVSDPSDIPQIKRFYNYYLPTTIKLLHTYDRMGSQQIEGDNISKSMANINDMLDTAITAYRKRLDSLFADQAMDIETDIEVMNTLMAREGLADTKDF